MQTRRRALAAANRGLPIDPDSNYCFGEGGAGTYSDGKLYARSGSRPAIAAVLETLVAHGAPVEILASWRPHVGSNRLPHVVRALRETVQRSGGTIRFATRLETIETAAGGAVRRRRRIRSRRAMARAISSRAGCPGAVDGRARPPGALEAKGFAMGVRTSTRSAGSTRDRTAAYPTATISRPRSTS